ncbi:multicomponent Na+:H+ antiporter subunit E [Modestobacter sp. DSM 44400]|uniref:Na+/H+ antiporter subunit E n=1 Tax=Modestobacter sp. DSM 44400 TaxID=1550230 RepID=UPI00089A3A0C|nr:Na+/H+ antiporter subunit E [Modestobacter sp. DSM 44400]SDY43255.1 multicomponent Na+:H+ antiporter subunit E [Modestobacter sp. DSM 44400]
MSRGRLATRLRHQLPLLAWLVLVWILLWGTWSWANLISGLTVALAVTALLPLPPVTGGARLRPLPLVRFVGHFLADLVVSSAQVAWETVRPDRNRRGAIVAVQLRTDSDLLLTVISETLTLVPGSLVIELDREQQTIALHLLSVRDRADVDRQKAAVLAIEDRVVRAFGSAADVAALDRQPDQPERTSS